MKAAEEVPAGEEGAAAEAPAAEAPKEEEKVSKRTRQPTAGENPAQSAHLWGGFRRGGVMAEAETRGWGTLTCSWRTRRGDSVG